MIVLPRRSRARNAAARGWLSVIWISTGFKLVNDYHGHAAGDRLLVEIATRLRQTLRGEDTVARLGGDEFVMLFGDLSDSSEIGKALDRVLAEVNRPVLVEGGIASVSASIGYTLYPEDASGCRSATAPC